MIRQNKKTYKIILAVFGLLIFLNLISLLYPANKIFGGVFNFFGIKMRSGAIYLSEKKENKVLLAQRIEDLEKKLAQEKNDKALISSLQEENRQLKNFFNFSKEIGSDLILADIVWGENFLNFSNINQSLIINKGDEDGLEPGLVVVNDSGILLGKILEVQKDYSRICLFNNSFCKLAVSLDNEEVSSGLAEGNLGLSIKINFIPQNEKVEKGNIVFSSGLEKNIPKGLYLGEVVNIEKKENDIWQEVLVEPYFGLRNLSRVAIVVPVDL